ncbi:hypothetical protein [Desulfosarcina alkanivorans]|uniref:hypothetical protein n=1 Tax=Desulfosarcina alkanivorans TaxID=571177 RepID=UPI001E5DF4DD|nr:hypothetical protein [Desulfosarcina alkanivorans]
MARVADYEAFVAAANIIAAIKGDKPRTINYQAVPAILFSYPQLAMVARRRMPSPGQAHHTSYEA